MVDSYRSDIDVVRLNFIIDTDQAEFDSKGYMNAYKNFIEERVEIERVVQREISQYLGEEYTLTGMEIRRGSIEVLLVIGCTAISGYTLISQYEAFVNSLNILRQQLAKTLAKRANVPPRFVSSNWVSGRNMPKTPNAIFSNFTHDFATKVSIYLMISNGVLIGMAVFLIVSFHILFLT